VRVDGGGRRTLGHDEIAPGGGRREHAVVGETSGRAAVRRVPAAPTRALGMTLLGPGRARRRALPDRARPRGGGRTAARPRPGSASCAPDRRRRARADDGRGAGRGLSRTWPALTARVLAFLPPRARGSTASNTCSCAPRTLFSAAHVIHQPRALGDNTRSRSQQREIETRRSTAVLDRRLRVHALHRARAHTRRLRRLFNSQPRSTQVLDLQPRHRVLHPVRLPRRRPDPSPRGNCGNPVWLRHSGRGATRQTFRNRAARLSGTHSPRTVFRARRGL